MIYARHNAAYAALVGVIEHDSEHKIVDSSKVPLVTESERTVILLQRPIRDRAIVHSALPGLPVPSQI